MTRSGRLTIDLGLSAAFAAAYFPSRTGLTWHEWLSLALATLALVHLVVNWDWVLIVAKRLMGRIRTLTRLNFVVDSLLFAASVTVVLSGVMVSRVVLPALGLSLPAHQLWHTVHSVSADGVMMLAMVHLSLHYRWMARAVSGSLRSLRSPEEGRTDRV